MEETAEFTNYIVYGLSGEPANEVYSLLGRKLLEKDKSLNVFDVRDAVERYLGNLGFNFFRYASDGKVLKFGLCFLECAMVDAVQRLQEGEQVFYRLDEEFESTSFTTKATVCGEC